MFFAERAEKSWIFWFKSAVNEHCRKFYKTLNLNLQRINIIKLSKVVNSLIRQFTRKVIKLSKLSIKMKTRKEAIELLHEWVKSSSLQKHCIAVAVAMEKYALVFDADIDDLEHSGNGVTFSPESPMDNSEKNNDVINRIAHIDVWWMCGLLHDMDYEKFPDINVHPIEGCKELRKREYDERIIEAILGHNSKTGIKRYSKMAKTLFAVDELCGLIMALAKVRLGNFEGMGAESVKKAMKKKDFAAGISREDILKGIEELEVNEDEHFENVVEALKNIKGNLGF